MPRKKYYERYRDCYKEKDAEWRANNKDKVKATKQRFYENNRESILAERVAQYYENQEDFQRKARESYHRSTKNVSYHLYKRVKRRAKETGITFDLEPEDVAVPEFCPVLGIPLFRNPTGKGACDNSPTIDRLNPKLGYTKNNITVISYRANRIKNDASLNELKQLTDWLEKRLESVE